MQPTNVYQGSDHGSHPWLTMGSFQGLMFQGSKVGSSRGLSTVSIEPLGLGLRSRKASDWYEHVLLVMYHLYSEEYLCNIPGIVD